MRYRAAPSRERRQIRWVLFAGVVAVLVGVIPTGLGEIGLIPPMGDALGNLLFALSAALIPSSLVVAVIEPPWLDVDVLIRKALVYGALSVAILLVYTGIAAAPGPAGARLGLDVEAVVVLTVIIAVLFQPARRRLQAVADRWVFGARPSKYEAVTVFGVSIEQMGEPAALLAPLVETIRTTIRLDWATAVLDDGTRAETGSPAGNPDVRVPVGAGYEQIGEILCGPKSERAWDDSEIQLVRTLAGQMSLALMNARLAARIVEAAESERRRIEQNIHDGVQQELVALVAQLGMARSAAARGALTPTMVDGLRIEAQHVMSDLRELAQGIHPSVLSDGGILEAVEERCARLPLQVTVETSEGPAGDASTNNVEGAAYFFITESLANVLKHASATRVTVSVISDAGRLLLGVAVGHAKPIMHKCKCHVHVCRLTVRPQTGLAPPATYGASVSLTCAVRPMAWRRRAC
jgi:signal transduction histidine kinase